MIRVNCKLEDNIINSDLFFSHKDNGGRYDILIEDFKLRDIKQILKVLNQLKFNTNNQIVLKGRIKGM